MKLAYIIGPYGNNSDLNRDEQQNTDVAEYLAKKAFSQGYAPLVPHSMIHSGIFGQDSDPAQRKKGEEATLALLSTVMQQPNVELWVIADYFYNFWYYSPGTQKELNLWIQKKGTNKIKHFLYPAIKEEMEAFSDTNMAH